MGRRKKEVVVAVKHIDTNIKINTNSVCEVCPYRIFADNDERVTLGVGNIQSNFVFVLPTYDIKSHNHYSGLISQLKEIYKDITGKELFENIYTTRLVKCSNKNEHNIYSTAIAPCSSYFSYEMNNLPAKHIVFFGSTYEDYNNNKDTVALYLNNKYVYKVYSPGVIYYDNDTLKTKLYNDLRSILSNN